MRNKCSWDLCTGMGRRSRVMGRRVAAIATSIATAIAGLLIVVPARIQPAGRFYRGKTMEIPRSASAGGGYDIYARALARTLVIICREIRRSWSAILPGPAACGWRAFCRMPRRATAWRWDHR